MIDALTIPDFLRREPTPPKRRHREHDPQSEFLWGGGAGAGKPARKSRVI